MSVSEGGGQESPGARVKRVVCFLHRLWRVGGGEGMTRDISP